MFQYNVCLYHISPLPAFRQISLQSISSLAANPYHSPFLLFPLVRRGVGACVNFDRIYLDGMKKELCTLQMFLQTALALREMLFKFLRICNNTNDVSMLLIPEDGDSARIFSNEPRHQ
ncbi:hypothetical protein AVEN_36059-1 [Araneus ventricosus]|uniref:Uncharacterized protein n=1 Tax=Araneus ventricosus TaxID=182803 RepID=A0A4Y2JSL9_ARAVE|nr:hypothetical protein AVEN_36059-1 [Araneus ventricosus]